MKKRDKRIIYGSALGAFVVSVITSCYMYYSLRKTVKELDLEMDEYDV